METQADSWTSQDQEQFGLSSFLLLWGSSMFVVRWCESFLQSLQLSRMRVGCHCQKNINQWKDRVVSSSWVISVLCSNMIEILESKGISSGHSLITWKFCCKGNHVRKGLKRKHETKHRTKFGVAVVQSRLWRIVRDTLLVGAVVLVGTELPRTRGV